MTEKTDEDKDKDTVEIGRRKDETSMKEKPFCCMLRVNSKTKNRCVEKIGKLDNDAESAE